MTTPELIAKLKNHKGETKMKDPLKSFIGKKVIVRANVAGVHAGIVESIDGVNVVLKNPRRLWRVYTRDKTGSMSDIAANGLKEGGQHQIGAMMPSILIINPNGLEIAEMTDKAYASVSEYGNG